MATMQLKSRLALLGAAFMALGSQAAWANPTVASASASLNNLTFRLIDLDPNDGITPGMTIQGPGSVRAETYGSVSNTLDSGFPSITGPTLPSLAVHSSLGSSIFRADGVVSASTVTVAGSLLETTTSTGSDMYRNWHEASFKTTSESWGSGGQQPSAFYFPDGALFITLTAHTGLVLEGNAATALALSNQAMHDIVSNLESQVTGFSAEALRYSSVDTSVAAGVTAMFASLQSPPPGTSVILSQFSFNDTLQESTYGCDGLPTCGPRFAPDQSSTSSQDFALDYANTTGQSTRIALAFSTSTELRHEGYLKYYESSGYIPVVPEPGTYALMSLGLLGLGWARHRHARS